MYCLSATNLQLNSKFICVCLFFFEKSLEWRKQWDVDKIGEWKTPQILKDHLPHGQCGEDKDGAPGKFIKNII